MAKKRKTRNQKILAKKRSHQAQMPISIKTPERFSFTPSIVHTANITVSTNSNPGLRKDVMKTFMLSGSIIAIELILFSLFKNHIITLPNLGY